LNLSLACASFDDYPFLFFESVFRWALGCIFGELLKHDVLLPGKTEIKQLERIIKFLGFPSSSDFQILRRLPKASAFNFKQLEGASSSVARLVEKAGISAQVSFKLHCEL